MLDHPLLSYKSANSRGFKLFIFHLNSWFRLLVQQGNKVSDRDQSGNSPLHLAAQNGNKEAARVLLHHGASMNDRNTAGLSPLHVASKYGHGGVVDVLVQNVSGSKRCTLKPRVIASFDLGYESEGVRDH